MRTPHGRTIVFSAKLKAPLVVFHGLLSKLVRLVQYWKPRLQWLLPSIRIVFKLFRAVTFIRAPKGNMLPQERRQTEGEIVCASQVPQTVSSLLLAPPSPTAVAQTLAVQPYSTYSNPSDASQPANADPRRASTSTIAALASSRCSMMPVRPPLSQEVVFKDKPDEERRLVAVAPREFERYDRNETYECVVQDYVIAAGQTSFKPPQTPGAWKSYVHPEGAQYFYDETRKILSDANLCDMAVYQLQEGCIRQIRDYMDKYQIPWSHDTTLVLELRQTGNIGYYFVSEEYQCVFWLEEFDFTSLIDEVKIQHSDSLVGHRMKSEYWLHNELFPNLRRYSEDTLQEFRDTLITWIGDTLTSRQANAPYDLEVLKDLLSLSNDFQRQAKTEYWAGSAWVLYRFIATTHEQRFLNLHGHRGARLNRDQSIHPLKERTWLIRILSPMFVFSPEVYLRKLQESSVDTLVNLPSWRKLRSELTEEWREFTLFATVLLNANVAFLAIQSVDERPHASHAQRSSYVSIIASMGTIILGLLLARQHQTTLDRTFLAHRGMSELGFETLALMYSLPYVLLMWGMLSFLLAFTFMCFDRHDTVTYILTSFAWFGLFLLVAWCISAAFEDRPYIYPLPMRIWHRLFDRWKERNMTDTESAKMG